MAAATLSDVVDPEERTRLANIIETEALRAGQIAGELQTLSSGAPARLEPVELVGWLTEEVDEHRRRGHEVAVAPREEPVTHAIDAVRLSEALSAVLSDALAASGRSGAPRVGVEVGEGGPTIVVRRDGAAPDAALLRMVADPIGAATVSDGSMLELTMASAHLRHQGGTLSIAVDGQVTTYHLVLPAGGVADDSGLDGGDDRGVDDDGAARAVHGDRERAEASAAPDARRASGAVPVEVPRGAQRLALIVDDEPAIRGLVEALLRRAGWMVQAASNAEEARQATRDQHFDAVLLDVNLDGRDGRELLTELDGLRPGTAERTAIITGDPSAAGSLHGRPVVTKPFVWAELSAVLDELTGQSRGTPSDPSVA